MATPTVNRTKTTQRKEKARSTSFGLWLVIASILLVALGVGLVILNNRSTALPPSTGIDLQADWINGKTLGNPNATVTIQAWEDFLCPHCRDWTATIEPKLFSEYIKTGKAKLEFHLLPLQGFEPGSSMAGMAAECAAEQNRFWQYHDLLFAGQEEGQSGYTQSALIDKAPKAGLDQTRFTECFNSGKHQATVSDSLNQAMSLGLTGTPSLFINGKQMPYPTDYPALQKEIDRLLGQSK